MEIEYIKSAAKVLNKDYINRRGLDLFKNILWVSIDQEAADLLAVKVGGQKKLLPIGQVRNRFARNGPIGRIFLYLHRSNTL